MEEEGVLRGGYECARLTASGKVGVVPPELEPTVWIWELLLPVKSDEEYFLSSSG